MLANLWGRVPLKLQYSDQAESAPRAASVADVWAVVESDFTDAISGLPLVYPSSDLGRSNTRRSHRNAWKIISLPEKICGRRNAVYKLLSSPFTYSLNVSYDNQFSDTNNISPGNYL